MLKNKIAADLTQSLFVMVFATFFTFGLMYLSPSDPAEMMFQSRNIIPSEGALEHAREQMGLNDPFVFQYVNWLKNLFHGDFGYSYISGNKVEDLFLQKLPYTIQLAGISLSILVLFSFVFGLLAALFKDGFTDWLIRILSLFSLSLPSFWLGLLLLYFFSIKLHLFPINSCASFKGVVLPAATLSLPLIGRYTRQIRTAFLEEMSSNYVVGLVSRRTRYLKIFLSHVLPNSMKGVIALLGLSLAGLLGGTVIVETIFSWPGIGSMAMEAITNRDYQVLQAYVLFMSVIYISMSFIVELIAGLVDPRFNLKDK